MHAQGMWHVREGEMVTSMAAYAAAIAGDGTRQRGGPTRDDAGL